MQSYSKSTKLFLQEPFHHCATFKVVQVFRDDMRINQEPVPCLTIEHSSRGASMRQPGDYFLQSSFFKAFWFIITIFPIKGEITGKAERQVGGRQRSLLQSVLGSAASSAVSAVGGFASATASATSSVTEPLVSLGREMIGSASPVPAFNVNASKVVTVGSLPGANMQGIVLLLSTVFTNAVLQWH